MAKLYDTNVSQMLSDLEEIEAICKAVKLVNVVVMYILKSFADCVDAPAFAVLTGIFGH